MIQNFLMRLLQAFALLALQVLILNNIHLMGFGTPLAYVALLLYFPLGTSRVSTMLWGFSLGLAADIFSGTTGMGAAAMVFAAFWQQPILSAMVPKDAIEDVTPNYTTMGTWNHIRYCLLLLALHHIIYFSLESFSFYHLTDTLLSFACSMCTTLAITLALETMRGRKKLTDE